MAGQHRRLRPVLGLVVAIGITFGWAAAPPRADAALSAWDGSVNLYRSGVFTTQKSWLWCTAAGVQIIRNIVDRREDHSRSNQSRYFEWMRDRNRYDLPRSAGVDPQGWAAGLRHYVDDRYRLVATDTFRGALRLAVTRIRKTALPVALTVANGNHGWILHGFSATADPATTSDFTVTSVRVTGPLWGLQNSSFGYDMKPNRKLTTRQLQRFFTKWWYAPKRMKWDGKYVSIQPVTPRASASVSGASASGASVVAAPGAVVAAPATVSTPPTDEPAAVPAVAAPAAAAPAAVATRAPIAATPAPTRSSPAPDASPAHAPATTTSPSALFWLPAFGAVVVLAIFGVAWRARPRRPRPPSVAGYPTRL